MICIPIFTCFNQTIYGKINCEQLYELLQLLSPLFTIHTQLEDDFLKILFIESRNDKPDVHSIINWSITRLNFYMEYYYADMLVRYVRLFRPDNEEIIDEYDAYERARRQRPLHIPTNNKKVWSIRVQRLIGRAKRNSFIEQRQRSSYRSAKQHSFSLSRGLLDNFKPKSNTSRVLPSNDLQSQEMSSSSHSQATQGKDDQQNLMNDQSYSPVTTPVKPGKYLAKDNSKEKYSDTPDSTPPATRNTSCTVDTMVRDDFQYLHVEDYEV
mmetsp:Transcript_12249/g.18555  ORF Transcript_12249/g.18555 Transcript_12249/m.18555 type:complete len:268 (+) Transcript_12249:101-904(+)